MQRRVERHTIARERARLLYRYRYTLVHVNLRSRRHVIATRTDRAGPRGRGTKHLDPGRAHTSGAGTASSSEFIADRTSTTPRGRGVDVM